MVVRGDGGAKCAANTTRAADAPLLTVGTWVNISPPGVPFDANATAFGQGITLDPCDVNTLYFAVEGFDWVKAKGGLYKSTNAGASWTKVGMLDEPINMVVDPENPQHIYASDGVRGNTNGFWISNDGGMNWTMPAGFKTAAMSVNDFDVYHVDVDPTDFRHVLLSFHYGWKAYNGENSGIFESFDGGDTWTIHEADPGWQGGGGFDVVFLFDPEHGVGDAKTWLYGTQGKGYWRTSDAGKTWSKVSDVSMEHGGTQIYYSSSGSLYVSGTTNVIRSTDNGLTWTKLPQLMGIGAFLSVTGDGTNLYTGSHGGGRFIIAKETNDTSWSFFNEQTFAEGPFEMAFDKVNGILYSSNIRGGAWALKIK
jgi:photosystem II stability/assembly factor-like uncharacterized protein